MSKGKKIGGIILVILGTIFLVIGIAIGALFGVMNGAMGEAVDEFNQEIEDFREHAVSTEGLITDIDSEGYATVEYYCEEDGWSYETTILVVSETYYEGASVEVLYDPNNPGDVRVPDMYKEAMGLVTDTVPGIGVGVGVFFGVLGAVLLIIGIVLLVNNKKDKKWVDEINARNASQGIGTAPYNGYQQPQGGQPMGGYGQPQGGQPMGGYGQPQNGGQAQPSGDSSNPYQQ